MKVTCEIELDDTTFVQVCPREDLARLTQAVNSLYGKLWCEACYDATNEYTKSMAKELLPHIEAVKTILRIKKGA